MLTDLTKVSLADADIGVISPYRAQCHKIIKLLRTPRTDGIKVGSVEEFQGQVCSLFPHLDNFPIEGAYRNVAL